MNQILNSEPNRVDNKSTKSQSNKKVKEPENIFYDQNVDTKSVSSKNLIKIFAIFMIIFAIGLISTGVYSIIRNQNNKDVLPVSNTPTAEITAEEVNGKVIINATDKKVITQLVYSWNGSKENKVQSDSKSIEKTIDLPAGSNSLLISVVNEDGVETTFEKTFESENGLDIINPEIVAEVVNAKLKIKVTDENALDFVTYRWNEEEEKRVMPEGNEKEIELDLEIKKGENDITIVAVDKNNNTTTERKTYKGVTQPEIVIVTSSDGSSLDITCKHENGIKKIEYTLNGQQYAGEYDDSPTSVQFNQDLDVGYNRIILTVTSVDDTKNTFDGQADYYPAGSSADNTDTTNTTNTTNTTDNTTTDNQNTNTNTSTNTNE